MAKNKDSNRVNQQISRAIEKKQIPILTLDNRWHMLFPEEKKTATIRRLEEQVNTLLKRQGKLVQEAKELKKLKRNFMKNIVDNMQESESQLGETTRLKELDRSQRYIKEINDKLKVYDDELEAIPKEIYRANEELLKASFELCYEDLRSNREQINELKAWIDETRYILKEKIVTKQELEQNIQDIYAYMHDILGAEMMELFDQEHL